MDMRLAVGSGASTLMLLLAGCTNGSSGLGESADCIGLTFELTKAEQPAAGLAGVRGGMCLPKEWAEGEVVTDFAKQDGTVWLASGDCTMFTARVWRSEDDGEVWQETGRLGTGLHCSAGSKMELDVQDEDTAEVAVTTGAVVETVTFGTENAGQSWKQIRVRCLNSDDPKACG